MVNLLNLTRIVNGTMLNNPAISAVESFAIEPAKVAKKGAFIALGANERDVRTAIDNGAYAIIFDNNFKPLNDEIAFIKVENLCSALVRLIKFLGEIWRHGFVLINGVQSEILRYTSVPKNLMFAPRSKGELFISLMNAKEKNTYFTTDAELLQSLGISPATIPASDDFRLLYGGSIFYSSFVFGGLYYSNLIFPQLFLPELCGVIEYLSRKNIPFKFQSLSAFGHFEPIFVDRFFNVSSLGGSYRAFIAESDPELFAREAEFLCAKFREKIIVCASWEDRLDGVKIDFRFNKLSALKSLPEFHYALVFAEKSAILQLLNQKPQEKNLFF